MNVVVGGEVASHGTRGRVVDTTKKLKGSRVPGIFVSGISLRIGEGWRRSERGVKNLLASTICVVDGCCPPSELEDAKRRERHVPGVEIRLHWKTDASAAVFCRKRAKPLMVSRDAAYMCV